MALVEVIRTLNGIELTFQEDEAVAKELGLTIVDRSAPAKEVETPEEPPAGDETTETEEPTAPVEETPEQEEPAPTEEPVKETPKKTSKK